MTANITPEGLSAHDHGNCELCDKIERDLAAALEELARLKAPVDMDRFNAEVGEAVFTETGCAADVVNADFARAALESIAAKLAEADAKARAETMALADANRACDEKDQQLAETRAEAHSRTIDAIKAVDRLDQVRKQLAERDAEVAALKGHAEAMWKSHFISPPHDYLGAFDAYRAAYPKE
jgi:hypothetical protein